MAVNLTNAALNLSAIMNFICDGQPQKSRQTEISETYMPSDEGGIELVEKNIREVNSTLTETQQSFRFELVKYLLDSMIALPFMQNEDDDGVATNNELLIVNTMLHEGFLTEINANSDNNMRADGGE